MNGDGRPDLYVANDEDPNQLYVNVPWPGGAKADPAGIGFRFEDRATAQEQSTIHFAGMGIASQNGTLLVTNSRGEPTAAFRQSGSTFTNARSTFDPALGTGFAGWGVTWVDLANSGQPRPRARGGRDPGDEARHRRRAGSRARADRYRIRRREGSARRAPTLNGRGVAAADAGNDGRMDVAINTIGGKLVLLRPTGPIGNWIDVSLSRFVPDAVVTVTLPNGQLARARGAGGEQLPLVRRPAPPLRARLGARQPSCTCATRGARRAKRLPAPIAS